MRAPLKLCFSSFAVVYTNSVILQSFTDYVDCKVTADRCSRRCMGECLRMRGDAGGCRGMQSFPPMRKPFLTYSECFAVAEYIMKRKDAYCNGCYVQDLEFAEGGGSEHLCF